MVRPLEDKTHPGGAIRVGVGGWTFEPWRGTFFPPGLPHKKELEYASRELSTIEINGTFYRTQKPETFRKWADETPDDFVFSVKAPRYATNKRVLAEAGPSIERFLESGLVELGGKLGPILWQFAPTKKFDADDFAAFLALLPAEFEGLRLRHALEVRHGSFHTVAFVALARAANAAIVLADSDAYPLIEETTSDFLYARLMRNREDLVTGYPSDEAGSWYKRIKARAHGNDAFVYFIGGDKVRAPSAARLFIEIARSEP